MTRGKYAAKAAGQRAAVAAETVDTLKAQLAAERAERTAEVADLKAQNQQLAGRLTREVHASAAAEVERVRAEAVEQIAAVRAEHHAKNLEAAKFIHALDLPIDHEDSMRLWELLGVDPGESISHYSGIPRSARRVTGSKARKGIAMMEQGFQAGGKRPW